MIYSILAKEKKHLNGKDYYKHLAQEWKRPSSVANWLRKRLDKLDQYKVEEYDQNGDGGVVRVPASEWLENCESQ